MSDKFQKLLGDLTGQHMMEVQELRDEVMKLKSENDCLKETNESLEPAVQDTDLTVQHMMEVQELRDEDIKLKSENNCPKETNESSDPAVQDSDLTAQHMLEVQELRDEVSKLKCENDTFKKTTTRNASFEVFQPRPNQSNYRSEVSASRWSRNQSYDGMSMDDEIQLARLHREVHRANSDPMRRICEDDGDFLPAEVHRCTRLANFLQSDAYEILVGVIILMNVLVMASDLQVRGTELGYSLGYPGYSEPGNVWQEASKVFAGLDLLFLALFSVDLILRTSVLHIRFFKAPLNWVDLVVVISGLIEVFGSGFLGHFLVRMLRLVKFGRAFRALQLSKVSHSVRLLGKCITASLGMLFWSLCLLFFIQCIGGMMLTILVSPFMENREIDPLVRRLVFRYYGTFSGSMLTMFEVLFANWPTACRILVDNVSEWFGLWFIIYRCLVGFAVLNVVNACFVQQTMSVAQQDTELMIHDKERAKTAYASKLRILFRELDNSGDGVVSWEEFAVLMTDDRLRSFLSAMEIDASDLQGLFEVLGDGSGNLSADDFIAGAGRINGSAKAVDMAQLLSIVKRLDSKLESSATSSQHLQQDKQIQQIPQQHLQQHQQQQQQGLLSPCGSTESGVLLMAPSAGTVLLIAPSARTESGVLLAPSGDQEGFFCFWFLKAKLLVVFFYFKKI
ncbi:unnamed protein product [Polarella glacialis]|uniref:EF-hand domain-containing protein n=1 Tax=Polarella glacialis TaxID=89957 RepID=A0A813K2S7_POLGL|nr:unnamed protein product [Polarella glacialis]